MKFIFIISFLASNLAFAQADDGITYTPPTKEQNESVKGTLTPPTSEQEKHIKKAAKKANKKKKKNDKKITQ